MCNFGICLRSVRYFPTIEDCLIIDKLYSFRRKLGWNNVEFWWNIDPSEIFQINLSGELKNEDNQAPPEFDQPKFEKISSTTFHKVVIVKIPYLFSKLFWLYIKM